MGILTTSFIASVVLTSCLAAFLIVSTKSAWLRITALALFVTAGTLAYLASVEIIGRPKPSNLDFLAREKSDAAVIAARLVPGSQIFMWLKHPQDEEPVAFSFPWNDQMAKELRDAMRRAGEDEVLMMRRKSPSDETNEPLFYTEPVPPDPEKDAGDPPEIFTHPSWRI